MPSPAACSSLHLGKHACGGDMKSCIGVALCPSKGRSRETELYVPVALQSVCTKAGLRTARNRARGPGNPGSRTGRTFLGLLIALLIA